MAVDDLMSQLLYTYELLYRSSSIGLMGVPMRASGSVPPLALHWHGSSSCSNLFKGFASGPYLFNDADAVETVIVKSAVV